MIIFRDIVSGDELFSDSNRYEVVDDCIYKIQVKNVVRRDGEIVLAGSNPSAEEADEGTDEAEQRGLDVVLNARLVETGFQKSSFKTYAKTYGKALVDKMTENEAKPEEIEKAKKRLVSGMQFILKKFDNLQFFIGESCNPDGAVVFAEYIDNEPVMYALVAGIDEEKV